MISIWVAAHLAMCRNMHGGCKYVYVYVGMCIGFSLRYHACKCIIGLRYHHVLEMLPCDRHALLYRPAMLPACFGGVTKRSPRLLYHCLRNPAMSPASLANVCCVSRVCFTMSPARCQDVSAVSQHIAMYCVPMLPAHCQDVTSTLPRCCHNFAMYRNVL